MVAPRPWSRMTGSPAPARIVEIVPLVVLTRRAAAPVVAGPLVAARKPTPRCRSSRTASRPAWKASRPARPDRARAATTSSGGGDCRLGRWPSAGPVQAAPGPWPARRRAPRRGLDEPHARGARGPGQDVGVEAIDQGVQDVDDGGRALEWSSCRGCYPETRSTSLPMFSPRKRRRKLAGRPRRRRRRRPRRSASVPVGHPAGHLGRRLAVAVGVVEDDEALHARAVDQQRHVVRRARAPLGRRCTGEIAPQMTMRAPRRQARERASRISPPTLSK